MLAISVREAIRDAVSAFGPPGGEVPLASPSTCEAIFNAIQKRFEPRVAPKKKTVVIPDEVDDELEDEVESE